MIDETHIRGASNKDCPACCCLCKLCKCGGNIHHEVVDDDPEYGYIHIFRCDKCDDKQYYCLDPERTIEFRGDDK